MKTVFKQPFFWTSLVAVVIIVLFFGVYVFAWTTPSQDPPGGNIVLETGATPAGSTGYIQFNDANNLGADSNLFWDNTNKRLGIGTNVPGALLEVRNMGIYAGLPANTDISFIAKRRLATDSTNDVIGVYGQAIADNISSDSYGGYFVGTYGSNRNKSIGIYASGVDYGAIIMGNVGIGTTSPGYKLDVSGNARITTNLGVGTTPNSSYAINAAGGTYGIWATGSTMGGRFVDSDGTSTTYVAYGGYGIYTGQTGRFGAGNFNGAVNMNSNKITNLATPTGTADAATKGYVECRCRRRVL